MEAPKQIKPSSLADYLEIMSKAVFQTGISWKVVEAKWPGTREAFQGFDPLALTKLKMGEIEELAKDTRIIRNFRKVDAIIGNARRMLELDESHGSFVKYLRSFNSYDELARDLKKQFKFLGDMGCYYFLWVVGEKVPAWEEWSAKYRGRK
jgi:3-methyladenine DNA glycosylase Tag